MNRGVGKWTVLSIGAVSVILVIWGFLGVGKASVVIPEPNSIPAATADGNKIEFEEVSGGVKKYDAALYLRGKPLKDPFHAKRSYISRQENQKIQGTLSALSNGKSLMADQPVLQGVMAYGGNRRAMIAVNGETVTVKEGEQVGVWSVVSIKESTVKLSSKTGDLLLELP